jgi:hypothetical protein
VLLLGPTRAMSEDGDAREMSEGADVADEPEPKPEPLDGPKMFKAIFRQYPLAKVEDYFQNGAWLLPRLEVDGLLLSAHRIESGAPEPAPEEEIQFPELPKPVAASRMHAGAAGGKSFRLHSLGQALAARRTGAAAAGAGPRPIGIVQRAQGAAPVPAPRLLGRQGAAPRPLGRQGTAASGSAPSPLELTRSFIDKWQLDVVKTKLQLARLNTESRRWIMDNFQPASASSAMGSLTQFIAQHGVAGSASVKTSSGPIPAGSVKRPLSAGPVKRPLSNGAVPLPKRATLPTRTIQPLGARVRTAPSSAATNGSTAGLRPGIVRNNAARPTGATKPFLQRPTGAGPSAVGRVAAPVGMKKPLPSRVTSPGARGFANGASFVGSRRPPLGAGPSRAATGAGQSYPPGRPIPVIKKHGVQSASGWGSGGGW